MGRVADLVMDALVAEVKNRTEWDEPPALFFVYLEAGRCRVSALPLPDEVWALDAPPRVLSRIADGGREFSGLLQAAAPLGLHGAAFRCEAWAVEGGKPGTERASEVAAASTTPGISGAGRSPRRSPSTGLTRCSPVSQGERTG